MTETHFLTNSGTSNIHAGEQLQRGAEHGLVLDDASLHQLLHVGPPHEEPSQILMDPSFLLHQRVELVPQILSLPRCLAVLELGVGAGPGAGGGRAGRGAVVLDGRGHARQSPARLVTVLLVVVHPAQLVPRRVPRHAREHVHVVNLKVFHGENNSV